MTVLSRFKASFVFEIIGEGSEKDNLVALSESLGIKNKVRFWGELDNPFPIVGAADVFLFGSHFEGFPNVLIEAGACGTPVVAFDCQGGINEIVEDGVNGYVVANDDFDGFEKALQKIVEKPLNRREIAKKTEQKFDISLIIKKIRSRF